MVEMGIPLYILVSMENEPDIAQDWLKSPIETAIGTIWMAGHLRNTIHISKENMRILGKYALVLVLEGSAYYEDTGKNQAKLESGHAILVSPALPHAYGSRDGAVWKQTYVVFDGPQFDLLQQSPGFREPQPTWQVSAISSWNERLKSIFAQPTGLHPKQGLRQVSQFTQFLVDLATDALNPPHGPEAWLRKSIDLLGEARGGTWMQPQQVSTEVGMSYENFRKLFAQHLGSPPAKFQKQRKIDLASAAIYRGATNFKQLAEELGFCDVYHFSKVFRQVKGMPPSTYRRSVQGK